MFLSCSKLPRSLDSRFRGNDEKCQHSLVPLPFDLSDSDGVAGGDAGVLQGLDDAGAHEPAVELDVRGPVRRINHDRHSFGGGPIHYEYTVVLDIDRGPAPPGGGADDRAPRPFQNMSRLMSETISWSRHATTPRLEWMLMGLVKLNPLGG